MNTKYSNIRVLVARSVQAVEDSSCDDVRNCDTIAEAKKFARYSLTPEYQMSGEFSEPMEYARVVADENEREVIITEFYRKGFVPMARNADAVDE